MPRKSFFLTANSTHAVLGIAMLSLSDLSFWSKFCRNQKQKFLHILQKLFYRSHFAEAFLKKSFYRRLDIELNLSFKRKFGLTSILIW